MLRTVCRMQRNMELRWVSSVYNADVGACFNYRIEPLRMEKICSFDGVDHSSGLCVYSWEF
jgi:hypothetical protein